jgi:hypothetical protein
MTLSTVDVGKARNHVKTGRIIKQRQMGGGRAGSDRETSRQLRQREDRNEIDISSSLGGRFFDHCVVQHLVFLVLPDSQTFSSSLPPLLLLTFGFSDFVIHTLFLEG